MKMICWALGLFFSTVAMAYPEKGDTVQFRRLPEGTKWELKNEGLDPVNHVWDVQVTQGSIISNEKWNQEDMPQQKEVLSVLKNCSAYAGVSEKLTVPAGTFQTCKFSNDSGGSTWIADVPFGMIKVDTTDVHLELIQFSSAK